MKRFLWLCVLSLMVGIFFFPTLAVSGTKTLTFAWNQTISNDFAGWKLYRATTAGGPYTVFATIPYGGTQQTEYTSSQTLTVPDNQTVTYYWTLTAFDTAGNESGKSNEVFSVIDFQAPNIPLQLKITVTN